jgi:uncharacterized membrane protein YbhN (UPF0104 family)
MPSSGKLYRLIVTILFIFALIILISRLSFDVVYSEIIDSNKFFLSLGVMSLILASFVKIIRFSLVARYYHQSISLLEASLIQMVGISIAILTPARVGEGSKAVLLNKRLSVPMTSSFGIVIFERFFDMILLSAGAFLFSLYFLQGKFTALIGFLFLALLALFVLFLRYFNHFKKLTPEKYKKHFTDVKLKGNPLLALAILIATGFTWMLEAGLPWYLAHSMNVSIPYSLVFGVVCISTIAVVISILPAGLGTMDLSFLVLFPLLGVTAETALSILLIYRFFGVLIPFLFATLLVHYYGMSLKEIKQRIEG